MRKTKRIALFILCALAINTVAVQAYSGSFSFEIYSNVTGSTKHNLSNLNTSCSASANTYKAGGSYSDTKDSYTVSLVEDAWFGSTYTSGSLSADGYTHSYSYNKVSKGKYNVSVVNLNPNAAAYGRYFKGSGSIVQ